MPNGGTAEVQIVTPEIQAITDQTHRLYTQGRNFPEGSPERAHYWGQAAVMHQQALEKFLARNEQPAGTTTFAPGDRSFFAMIRPEKSWGCHETGTESWCEPGTVCGP